LKSHKERKTDDVGWSKMEVRNAEIGSSWRMIL
jgi:hypothetical protein